MKKRAYTVYKDETGTIFGEFDDMMKAGFYPATAKGKLTPISSGTVTSCRELFAIERSFKEV